MNVQGDGKYDPLPEVRSLQADTSTGPRMGLVGALLRTEVPVSKHGWDPVPHVLGVEVPTGTILRSAVACFVNAS